MSETDADREADSGSGADADADDIRALENRRFEALVTGDLDGFAEIAHPELAYTHSSGTLDTLDSYLTKCASGFFVYHWIEHPIDRITVIGDTAIVIGEMRADLSVNGVHRKLENRSLAVWTRVDGKWKFLAYQATARN
ncbi:nuclear transport factor 2 family protein [Kitasatospora cathayae]|uniref:Nuclear transport factor 2 family protein n=1 Tax=Kitasatospora cathayae TaxID=3004092 RepID=A0ABY7QDV6_9ACTN|nr:nuclear transport factor 2 family protein [Kitasatospora sp. HUAS 3-15]WBP90908.1 nuclear transport factor 2 family protein [Kitasatospora sp. HUAS 3-15]